MTQELHPQRPVLGGSGEHVPGFPLTPSDGPGVDHLGKGQRYAERTGDQPKGQIADPRHGRQQIRESQRQVSDLEHLGGYRLILPVHPSSSTPWPRHDQPALRH